MTWADPQFAAACADDAAGARKFGASEWMRLRRRLATLRAAPTLGHLAGTPGAVTLDRAAEAPRWLLEVSPTSRLAFVPIEGDAAPLDEAADVAGICLLGLVDMRNG